MLLNISGYELSVQRPYGLEYCFIKKTAKVINSMTIDNKISTNDAGFIVDVMTKEGGRIKDGDEFLGAAVCGNARFCSGEC